MTAVSGWQGGRLSGFGATYATIINSADISSLANGSSCMSSVADIDNTTALDMFMDISYALAISSSTIAAGANFAFFVYNLDQDGTHYGDNQLSSGTPAAITPSFPPAAVSAVPAVASTTAMYGTASGILLPIGKFRIAIQNNCGFTLSGTQTVKARTYNIRGDNTS